MNIAMLELTRVKDIRARWVTRLLTQLPGSLGILTVSSSTAIIHGYFLPNLTPHRPDLKYGKSSTRLIVRNISTVV